MTTKEYQDADRCEWDPKKGEPAVIRGKVRVGCLNEATLVVGHNGRWFLCDSCAKLPAFNRFKVRSTIVRIHGEGEFFESLKHKIGPK